MDPLQCGNRILDDGHDRLARQLASVWCHWRDTLDPDGMIGVLNAFVGQLSTHFSVEDVILTGAGFHGADAHARRHADILCHLREIPQRVRDQTAGSAAVVMQNVYDMICDHERIEDRSYWSSVQAQISFAPPRETVVFDVEAQTQIQTQADHLDGQHQGLLRHCVQLGHVSRQGDPAAFFRSVRDFRALAVYHIRVEAQMQPSVDDLSDPAEGQSRRSQTLRTLDSVVGRVRQGHVTPQDFVDDFLFYWMRAHMQTGSDARLADRLPRDWSCDSG